MGVVQSSELGDEFRRADASKALILRANFEMERAKGIEPSYAAWEAAVLPLNYARIRLFYLSMIFSESRYPLFRIMLPID
jgi:hypothetical protein